MEFGRTHCAEWSRKQEHEEAREHARGQRAKARVPCAERTADRAPNAPNGVRLARVARLGRSAGASRRGGGAARARSDDERQTKERGEKGAATREGVRRFGLRPRRGSRRAGIARAPRASRAAPCVKHARHAPAAGVGSGARARTQREEAAGGREATQTRGPRAPPPPSARTARSPRAPCALHEGGGGSLASPRTRRHTDARRRRGAHSTARRAMKDRRTTRGENDSHYHPRTLFGCGGESRQTTRPHAASAPRGPRPSRCALDTGSLRAERRAK